MSFNGYSKDIQTFFQELKAHNNKEWFTKNRSRFDDLVMEPSIQLVAALAEPLSDMNPALKAEPKVNGSIRRVFRDTRFAKDKTPYHTHLHLIFWAGDHPNRSPGVHIVLADDHFGYGAGHWGFEGEQLERFRADVTADKGKGVQRVIDAVSGHGAVLDDPALKQVPKGFDRDEDWSQWARYKGLVVKSGDQPYPQELFGAGAVDYVAGICKAMQPLNRYLSDKVFN